ncbi:MAG: ADP-ribose pyrophosphatase YjhB (NUDIX family) [Planctomycetota bacterium]|jgi:ADP-ribose pyrophosphatase YjhB (NUDIX family)
MNTPQRKLRMSCRGIIRHDNKILLQNVDSREYWNLPGGGFEPYDESFEACTIREIKEETGMDTTLERLLFVQEFKHRDTAQIELFFLLKGTDFSQYNEHHTDLDKPDAVNRLSWFTNEEIQSMDVRPAFIGENIQQLLDNPCPIFTQGISKE